VRIEVETGKRTDVRPGWAVQDICGSFAGAHHVWEVGKCNRRREARGQFDRR
jgi:hypothetical protein